MSHITARITGIGTYVPDRILDNAELETMVETNDEWIVRRTGIRERRITASGEFTSDMCMSAVRNLTERYETELQDIDLIITATQTPDYGFPSVSAQLQEHLNIQSTAAAFDLNATCAGFTYGLYLAGTLIESGAHRKALVIGAETMSKITDYTDRSTCVLFGDGAGAVVIEAAPADSSFLIASNFHTDGSGGIQVYRTGLSQTMNGQTLHGNGCTVQNGPEVYRWAVTEVPKGIRQLLDKSGLDMSQIDWFVPHSANMRMIESICEKSGIPLDRTLTSMEWYGNTSAASIPLALDAGIKSGRVHKGDRVIMYGFGAGLVSCGILIHY